MDDLEDALSVDANECEASSELFQVYRAFRSTVTSKPDYE